MTVQISTKNMSIRLLCSYPYSRSNCPYLTSDVQNAGGMFEGRNSTVPFAKEEVRVGMHHK